MEYSVSELCSKELILTNISAPNSKILLSKIADYLCDKGYVKESYKDAILRREELYPTGLPTNGVSIAIPHTDIEHAIKPCICIANLKDPVVFKQMADGVKDVNVEMIFVVVVTEPDKEVVVLKSLMDLFLREEDLLKLKKMEEVNDLYNSIIELLK